MRPPGHRASGNAVSSPADISRRLESWHGSGRPHLEPPTPWPSATVDESPVICPSQSGQDGTVVLGIIDGEGRLQRSARRQTSDTSVKEGETTLRLAGECQHQRCAFWSGSCQLAGAVVRSSDAAERLPACPVRRQCRWFLEHGPGACGTCSVVSYLMPRSGNPSAERRDGD
jgi:hypothetical protein